MRRHLVGAHEAPSLFGVSAEAVRQWARRRRILSVGLDRFGRPLYDAEDIRRQRDDRSP